MHKICAAVRHPASAPCGPRNTPKLLSKPLISLNFVTCLFLRHFKQGLDLQGLQGDGGTLSTKLSTEALDMSGKAFTSST
jgi:hypothetical protein